MAQNLGVAKPSQTVETGQAAPCTMIQQSSSEAWPFTSCNEKILLASGEGPFSAIPHLR